jgi:hypothetical protein
MRLPIPEKEIKFWKDIKDRVLIKYFYFDKSYRIKINFTNFLKSTRNTTTNARNTTNNPIENTTAVIPVIYVDVFYKKVKIIKELQESRKPMFHPFLNVWL